MSELEKAAEIIRGGGVVAFPTETVYGLGADAKNPMAVARIFELKERPYFDPLIVHIADMDQLKELTPLRDPRIYELAQAFWPGPLTMVLPKSDMVPDIVTSGLPTVGVRMPDHPMAQELIRKAGCPLAAPSANKFGKISPTEPWHVRKHLPDVDMILDGGKTRVGIESTVIALRPDGFQLLRPGAVTRDDLDRILPESFDIPMMADPEAPGMLASHYSPSKPFFLYSPELLSSIDPSESGFIGYQGEVPASFGEVLILSPNGDLKEYATKIFGAMHQMEASDVNSIVVEPVPEKGIGVAIMDRLRKAAHDWKSEEGE
ncbi:MAG: L-threonylcarbamoyladenylate synthase [Robiginitalea sp.]